MMDWSLHTHKASERPAPPQLDLLRLYWRLQAPSGKTLACGLYRTAAGMEVRCDYGGDNLIRSEFAPNLNIAGQVAEYWKMTALAKGGFLELVGQGRGEPAWLIGTANGTAKRPDARAAGWTPVDGSLSEFSRRRPPYMPCR